MNFKLYVRSALSVAVKIRTHLLFPLAIYTLSAHAQVPVVIPQVGTPSVSAGCDSVAGVNELNRELLGIVETQPSNQRLIRISQATATQLAAVMPAELRSVAAQAQSELQAAGLAAPSADLIQRLETNLRAPLVARGVTLSRVDENVQNRTDEVLRYRQLQYLLAHPQGAFARYDRALRVFAASNQTITLQRANMQCNPGYQLLSRAQAVARAAQYRSNELRERSRRSRSARLSCFSEEQMVSRNQASALRLNSLLSSLEAPPVYHSGHDFLTMSLDQRLPEEPSFCEMQRAGVELWRLYMTECYPIPGERRQRRHDFAPEALSVQVNTFNNECSSCGRNVFRLQVRVSDNHNNANIDWPAAGQTQLNFHGIEIARREVPNLFVSSQVDILNSATPVVSENSMSYHDYDLNEIWRSEHPSCFPTSDGGGGGSNGVVDSRAVKIPAMGTGADN